jgi:hypothetical protein
MKQACCTLCILMCSLFLASGLRAEDRASFYGHLVSAPMASPQPDTLYLQGSDGNVRQVTVARAAIGYAANVAAAQRRRPARRVLLPGTEVRVTALWDSRSGQWTASHVEVLSHRSTIWVDSHDVGDSGLDPVASPSNPLLRSHTI